MSFIRPLQLMGNKTTRLAQAINCKYVVESCQKTIVFVCQIKFAAAYIHICNGVVEQVEAEMMANVDNNPPFKLLALRIGSELGSVGERRNFNFKTQNYNVFVFITNTYFKCYRESLNQIIIRISRNIQNKAIINNNELNNSKMVLPLQSA